MKMKKNNLLSNVFYLLVFFPYITLVSFGTDTQPYALLFSLLVLFIYLTLKREAYYTKLTSFLLVAMFSVVIGGVFNSFSFNAIRSIFGYISIFVISYASFVIIKEDGGVNIRAIKIIIILWGIVGLIQSLIHPGFLTQIVASGVRTTADRGITALAPEPTYYGQMMYFLMFIVIVIFKNRKEKIFYSLLCLLQITLFAQSSMIVFVLGLVLFVFALEIIKNRWTVKKLLTILLVCILMLIFLYILNISLTDSRLLNSINRIIASPTDFFKNDASSNFRLSDIYFSFKGAFENYLVPHGFEKWQEYNIHARTLSEFFWYGTSARIMSMYGTLIFELGLIGMIIIFKINEFLLTFIKEIGLQKYRLTIILFINLIFFTAVPITTPFVGFMLGFFLYYGYYRVKKDRKSL